MRRGRGRGRRGEEGGVAYQLPGTIEEKVVEALQFKFAVSTSLYVTRNTIQAKAC